MNGLQAVTYLADVKPFKTAWRVHVKILHTWKQYTAQSGETYEMVLSDQKGTKIHASVKKALVSKYERHLGNGEWKFIDNFSLAQARGQYRVTSHQFKLGFVNNTFVTTSNFVNDDLFLSLTDFPTITVGDLNPFILIDVLGQVVNVGRIETVEANNKPTRKLEFEMRDIMDSRLPCTLWGKFADQLNSACENASGETLLCLIRFAKVSTFRGENQITNAFDLSVVMINPMLPEVETFKESLPKDGLGLTVSLLNPRQEIVVRNDAYFNQYPKKTIACLQDITEIQKCKIICTVRRIDSDMGWFYIGCKKCSKKVEPSTKNDIGLKAKTKKACYWCPKCSLNITQVVPRYKLHVQVMDHTADANCIIFDMAAAEIVGCTAAELLGGVYDEELQDPENLPMEIKNLVGKTFQLLFCVENDNLHGGNDTFRVAKIWSGVDMDNVDTDNDIDDSDVMTNPSQIISGGQEILLLTNGTEVADSSGSDMVTPSSTPSKRGADSVVVEKSSTTKKVCLNSVEMIGKQTQQSIKLERVDERKIQSDGIRGSGSEDKFSGLGN